MSTFRRSLNIPTDDDGLLGRECPRCLDQFKIDIERYQNRGFMNLRCPYCKFISKLDDFTTGEQRQYLYASTQNLGLQVMEDAVEEMFDDVSELSSGPIEFEVESGDVDFGRMEVESPTISAEVKSMRCEECEFSYSVEVDRDGVCPVCR